LTAVIHQINVINMICTESMSQSGNMGRTNLTWRLTDELGRSVVGGIYAAGDVLPNEAELSARNGVGRSAVREAVKVLEGKGLLESRPRRGTAVLPTDCWNLYDPDLQSWMRAAPPMPGLLSELLEMRQAFEPAAARFAAMRSRPASLEALHAAYAAMQAASEGRADPHEADLRFHATLLDASGNRFMAALAPLIGTALLLSFRVTNAARGDPVGDLQAHGRVLAAVAARDAAGAEAAMHALLADVAQVLAKIEAKEKP